MTKPTKISEFRISITAEDYEKLVAFYRDGFDLPTVGSWEGENGRGIVLDIGRATLEILDPTHAAYVDNLEAGKRVSGTIRFALEVDDVEASAEALQANGAEIVHPTVDTPWGDRNQRIQAPDGMQVTLFTPGDES